MKNKSYKTLLAVGFLTLTMASRGVAADAVKVCVEGAYPPFSTISPSGEVVGFDIDIANALIKQMGKTPVMVKMDWDGMIPALLAKKCDAIIASMSITDERKKKIDFSDKYYNTPARFAGKKSANLSDDAGALKGKTVGVQQGTVSEAFMKKKYPDVKLRSYATQESANADLVAGRLDAIFVDSIPLGEFLKTPAAKGFAAFGKDQYDPAILGTGVGVGVRKQDTALRDDFSKAITTIRKNGDYAKINKKYFDFDIYGK
ncbi:MAG: transporter substrate-binding domain-containing protein [Hydrotalea sp.]|nr:transporter substrate-binding domain-containing protein [Hydrotalea sp.]